MSDEQTAGTLWAHVLARAEAQGEPAIIEIWLGPGEPRSLEDNRLVVAFPPHSLDWITRRYGTWIGDTLRSMGLAGARLVSSDSAVSPAQEESTG